LPDLEVQGHPQGCPGAWLGEDPVGVRGRDAAQDAFDPALVHEQPPFVSAMLLLMPAICCFTGRFSLHSPLPAVPSLSIHPLSPK